MRLDKYLFEKGFAKSRQKAQSIIDEGLCVINGQVTYKASCEVGENDAVQITGNALKYVGRGGIKLEGALEYFNIDVRDALCADIGASTGGFTDCLIQRGAKKVYAIDSGHGQLHPLLLSNDRVINIEGFNAKNLRLSTIGEKVDIVVMDVSFISQTLLYFGIADILKRGGILISLIKPQFEAGREYVKKGGIVKDKRVYETVLKKIKDAAIEYGFYCVDCIESPIKGKDGNTEFLSRFRYLPQGENESVNV